VCKSGIGLCPDGYTDWTDVEQDEMTNNGSDGPESEQSICGGSLAAPFGKQQPANVAQQGMRLGAIVERDVRGSAIFLRIVGELPGTDR